MVAILILLEDADQPFRYFGRYSAERLATTSRPRFNPIAALAWIILLYLTLPILIVFPVSVTDFRMLELPRERNYNAALGPAFLRPTPGSLAAPRAC